MKTFLLILIFSGFASSMQNPDTWEICRGKKILLKAKEADPVKTIILSSSDTSSIVINYKEAPSNVKWKRDFNFKNKADSIVLSYSFNYSSGKFRLPFNEIRQLIARQGSLTLNTEQHPAIEDIMIRSKIQALAVLQMK
jgi:hypothetical protein